MDKLKAELQHALGVPEQLFGDSFLRLTHEPSGTVLEFTALDALRCASPPAGAHSVAPAPHV